ncbi:MAG: HyaD/HybD family hydrogenase maturation endopeptidase [Thermodesulfovibrionales bacterium]|nr:HyaD/HybD family hydrogenase maturation endopeptidase [Thermodesulfovibrionales bacterium]
MESEKKKILILGIGNILLKDEGIGVCVAEKMKDMQLPPDVEVMDGGTGGLDLLYYIEGREKVIVVDAVKAGAPPGTLFRFTDNDLAGKKGFIRSAHGIDFSDVVAIAGFQGIKPEILFLGIEPEDITAGMELSPKIAENVPILINIVMKELDRSSAHL